MMVHPEFIKVIVLLLAVGVSTHGVVALSDSIPAQRDPDVLSSWSAKAGESALQQVTFLASKVAESTDEKGGTSLNTGGQVNVAGTGGVVYNNPEFNKGVQKSGDKSTILQPALEVSPRSKRQEQVWTALANLELDSKIRRPCQ